MRLAHLQAPTIDLVLGGKAGLVTIKFQTMESNRVADIEFLKLVLGLCLMAAGYLTFSLWHEHLKTLKDDEKAKFLMYNIRGGSWIFSVFFVCSGAYCLLEPFFGSHLY